MLFTVGHIVHKQCFYENKRLYHVVVLGDEATVLNCALFWVPQQTEKLLHLGYFHFWTLRQVLTLFILHTHKEEKGRERNQK